MRSVRHLSLNEIRIQPDWQILDIGAGSGTISTWLARHLTAEGRVTATDLDPSRIPANPRISPLVHDITRDDLPDSHYDLIHARLVLFHLPSREQVVQRLLTALRPGGLLLLHEFDCTYHRAVYGADPADTVLFHQILAGIHRVLSTAGARLDWGMSAHNALRAAGFADVSTRAQVQTFAGGDAWARLGAINTVQLHDRLLDLGLTAGQLKHFRRLMADPAFVALSYLMTRTLGRRPR